MISVTKVMTALRNANLVGEWCRVQRDASWNEDGSLMETYIEATPGLEGEVIRVDNEVYGNRAFLYFRCDSEENAARACIALKKAGAKPDFGWCHGNDKMFELRVSYFKGSRWWE